MNKDTVIAIIITLAVIALSVLYTRTIANADIPMWLKFYLLR